MGTTAASVPLLSWLTSAVRPLSDGATVGLQWLARQSWQATAQVVLAGPLIYVVLLVVGARLFRWWTRALADSGRHERLWAVSTVGYLMVVTAVPTVPAAIAFGRAFDQAWLGWLFGTLLMLAVCGLPLGGLRPAPLPPRRTLNRGPAPPSGTP